MNVIKDGSLTGAFTGFNGTGTAFTFADGTQWRQSDGTIRLCEADNPRAAIYLRHGHYYIRVTCLSDVVEVVPDI